jgi:inorganic phosphate transporter, PiT family
MVFALLIAAIIWNLGTWWFGLPASSSHTMVGSIIGVGIANQLMNGRSGTSGVDWEQAAKVFKVLLISPCRRLRRCAALLLLLAKPSSSIPRSMRLPKAPSLHRGPSAACWCSPAPASAFSTAPTTARRAWASSCSSSSAPSPPPTRSTTPSPTRIAGLHRRSRQAGRRLDNYVDKNAVLGDARTEVTDYIRTKQFSRNTMLALRDPGRRPRTTKWPLQGVQERSRQPADQRPQRHVCGQRSHPPHAEESQPGLYAFRNRRPRQLQKARWTRPPSSFPPGSRSPWPGARPGHHGRLEAHRRHRRRKNRQGAPDLRAGRSAELVAMATIFAADGFGLPVSTTHVLSSGVAGTMAANHG